MKGIVFSEFLELVEDKFGFDVADEIIDESDLASDGAYTEVGVYDHKELLTLVTKLSEKSGVTVEDLVKTFGNYLLERFVVKFPQYFKDVNNSFDFIDRVESKIHVEVKKLYPEAKLPTFTTNYKDENKLKITYESTRPFSALAYGMMMGCANYYGESIEIVSEDLSTTNVTKVSFTLNKT